MCPHTCSRVSAPEANCLKYSERRKGLRATSSVITLSNHASAVMGPPGREYKVWRRCSAEDVHGRAAGRAPLAHGQVRDDTSHGLGLDQPRSLALRHADDP